MTPRRARAIVPTEHAEQVALLRWVRLFSVQIPELGMLFAIPNGGHRNKAVAGKLRAEGVQAGVPDLFLAIARGAKHGLFVEMKRAAGGRVSPAQRAIADRLTAEGYEVAICAGWDAARAQICGYLGIEDLTRGAA